MTYNEAVDAILGRFKSLWDTTGHAVVWDDVTAQPPVADSPWARAIIKHADAGQGSLAGATGATMWDRSGVFYVQIFTPSGDGASVGRTLAQILTDDFQSAKGNIWYRNARMREKGRDGAWFMTLFSVDFEYTDVR